MIARYNLSQYNLKSSGSITPQNKPIIVFGGKTIDEAVPNIKIINVIVGPVGVETYADARNYRSGFDYHRRRGTSRNITVIVELPLSKTVYAENVRQLRAWAESDTPKALQLPVYKNDLIYATLTDFSEFSQRDWWLPIELVFTAWDPFFENVEYNSALVGEPFTIGGSGDPSVYIELTISGSVTNPEWTFPDGKKIKLVGVFSTGKIDINMDTFMVYHNDVSAMVYLTIGSRFPHFKPGTWLVSGPDGSTVRWKERWK